MFTKDNFIKGLQATLRNVEIENSDNIIIIRKFYKNYDDSIEEIKVVAEILYTEISEIEAQLNESYSINDFMLYGEDNFEVPVKPQDRMRMPIGHMYDSEQYHTNEYNYEFVISKASNKYVFALMCVIALTPDLDLDISLVRLNSRTANPISSFEDLCDTLRFITVKIKTHKQHTISEFKRLTNAYLFNISYNSDSVFTIMNLSDSRAFRRRRVRRSGQLFPFKSYNVELVNYYNQGMSTDIPFTQYLAFYHVAEFFFQTIAEQEAFLEIESFITRPSFSPYRKEDIRQFYNKIKKKMRDQREDGVWDEKTGLLLCLKKYIPDIETLKSSIMSIDSTAIEHYRTNDVSFADDGKIVDFTNLNEGTYSLIRNRVYSIRNSIVHSKDGERLKYEPFKHDKELAKEIPLIRAIAEEIIINSSKTIELKHEN